MTERSAQILIAGVGNTFMRDDGFGAEVVRVLKEREPEPGVTIEDFGTGGLDLAYEVMRGYDSLVLIDVMRGDGAARHALRARARGVRDRRGHRGRRDDRPARDGSADRAALRARRLGLAGQRRRDRLRARRGRGLGMGLSPEVAGAVPRAVELVARDARRPPREGPARERALTPCTSSRSQER